MYSCEEQSSFIRQCITAFEKLSPGRIEATLNGFINRYIYEGSELPKIHVTSPPFYVCVCA